MRFPPKLKKVICFIKGHTPENIVTVALNMTPENEPTITQFESWLNKECDVIGTATEPSYLRCKRCGLKLEEEEFEELTKQ